MAEEDVIRAYTSHVNAYIQKPVDFDSFLKAIKSLEEFWFSVVRLPTQSV